MTERQGKIFMNVVCCSRGWRFKDSQEKIKNFNLCSKDNRNKENHAAENRIKTRVH